MDLEENFHGVDDDDEAIDEDVVMEEAHQFDSEGEMTVDFGSGTDNDEGIALSHRGDSKVTIIDESDNQDGMNYLIKL